MNLDAKLSQLMMLIFLPPCNGGLSLHTVTYESNSHTGGTAVTSSLYTPSLQICANLCTEQTDRDETTCFSYSYSASHQMCYLSSDLSLNVGETTYTIKELQSNAATYSVTLQGACVRQFLRPVSNVSLGECFLLHESSYTPDEDFSYDATLRRCYPVVPKLPADFSCPSEDGVIVLLTRVNNETEAFGPPPKLFITGQLNSSESYNGISIGFAFDGSTGFNNHYIGARGITDPWLSGDIGSWTIIAGAKFWTRTNCCARYVQNIHFLVAMGESSLDDDYDGSLCSVYPGPPEMPLMRDDDTVWFPCPLKEGRYFKMLSITQSGNIDVCEIELFGY